MRKFLIGLAALLVIVVVLVGVPVALILVAGNPLPTGDQIHNMLTLVPDYGNVILLTKILPCLGWVAWILFAIPLLVEIGAAIAGRKTTKQVRVLKGQQYAAAALVAAVLVMFAGLSGAHITTPHVAAAPPSPTISIEHTNPVPSMTPVSKPIIEPAEAAAPPVPLTQTLTHVVVPGDNLWDISEQYYGVGTRDLDIFQASTGIVQPGGQRLTNPDLIRPGWHLTIPNVPAPPATTPVPDTAVPPQAGAGQGSSGLELGNETAPQSTPISPSVIAPTHSAESTPSPRPTVSSKTDNSTVSPPELAVPLTTAGGVVGLLAAGLLLALGGRRLIQRRRRRAGERIAMPDPDAADVEQELRMVADPLGLADIDHALRRLQTHAEHTGTALPELLAVRLAEQQLSFYFLGSEDLPEPFEPLTPDRTVWTLRPGTISGPSRATVSPYPALVIIGVDDNDGVILLDLEQVGVLNITGDENLAEGILNAVAAELAGNPWGEQIQVTLIGMPVALPRTIDRFRIQHTDDLTVLLPQLRRDLDERATALHSYGIDNVRTGRTRAAESESWAPHILLLAHHPEEPIPNDLADLVTTDGRLGVAVVAHGMVDPARATIRVEASGRAELVLPGGAMPPLPFTPQLLRGHELELLQNLFDTAENDAVHPVAGQDPVAIATRHDAPPPLDGPQEESVETHPWPVAETDDAAPRPEISELEGPAGSVAPYLRLLGPVEAEGLSRAELMPGRGVELMAYLLLRGGPVDGVQLQRAFWPDTPDAANNQRGLAKKVRLALGHTPTGELWLPENINHHGYTLHPGIRSDWHDFQHLVGRDPAVASTDNLIAALRLVRGTPFAGCNTRRWWQWIAIPQEDMIATIMDTADVLADRALRAQNASLARYAARIQQAVDPLNEAGWRIELRTALHTGDLETFHTVLEDLYARVGGDDPDYEVDDDTQALIDQANQRMRA
jgi:hypothetical protein